MVTVATDETVSYAEIIDENDINGDRVKLLDTVSNAVLLNVADGDALSEVANELEFVSESSVEKLGAAVNIDESVFVTLILFVTD